jgi:hypothetical protein
MIPDRLSHYFGEQGKKHLTFHLVEAVRCEKLPADEENGGSGSLYVV